MTSASHQSTFAFVFRHRTSGCSGENGLARVFSLTFLPNKDLAILDEMLPFGLGESA
jgi:hypothetical protein